MRIGKSYSSYRTTPGVINVEIDMGIRVDESETRVDEFAKVASGAEVWDVIWEEGDPRADADFLFRSYHTFDSLSLTLSGYAYNTEDSDERIHFCSYWQWKDWLDIYIWKRYFNADFIAKYDSNLRYASVFYACSHCNSQMFIPYDLR